MSDQAKIQDLFKSEYQVTNWNDIQREMKVAINNNFFIEHAMWKTTKIDNINKLQAEKIE